MAAPNQQNRPLNPIQMAEDRARGIRDYTAPANCNFNPGIFQPTLETERFELKPVMFQMLIAIGQFGGSPAEDPHSHLKSFLDICNKFIIPGVTHEQLQVILFPYSLRDVAKVWLNQQRANSIATWNDLAEKFLEKYFLPTANCRLRKEIMTFTQMEDETLSEAWERFKSLLQRCPHHGLPLCIQLETFYVGLNKNSQILVDSSANGALLRKTYDKAHAILDRIARNNYEWGNAEDKRRRPIKTSSGSFEVDPITSVNANIDALTTKMDALTASTTPLIAQLNAVGCGICGEGHTHDQCPSNPESVFYVGPQGAGRNNPFLSTYNPGWRNHPNFSWNGGANKQPQQGNVNPAPRLFNSNNEQSSQGHFQRNTDNGNQRPSSSNALENMMKEFMASQKEYMAKNDAVVQSQAASLRSLEIQVGQLALELKNSSTGTLPSNTEDPKGKEHCHAVTLRSGKQLQVND